MTESESKQAKIIAFVDDILERLDSESARLGRIRAYAGPMGSMQADGFNAWGGSGGYYITVTSLKELSKARAQLRKFLPGYSDKLQSISTYWDDKGVAYYKILSNGDEVREISLQLVAPIEGFPVKLKAGCGFKKVVQKSSESESWSYVCEKPAGGAI